eukprot:SAG31_NODE_6696_length_1922_cov_1.751509_2_plen_165_part_00
MLSTKFFDRGGLPYGIEPHLNVVKECYEEAGVWKELAERTIPSGAIGWESIGNVGEHSVVERACGFVYDLELPNSFKPVNTDGEVDTTFANGGFCRLPIDAVLSLLCGNYNLDDMPHSLHKDLQFDPTSGLVVLDFAVRHGLISADQPCYLDIVRGLRAGPLRT